MADYLPPENSPYADDSSDEECLANLKRKTSEISSVPEKRVKHEVYEEESTYCPVEIKLEHLSDNEHDEAEYRNEHDPSSVHGTALYKCLKCPERYMTRELLDEHCRRAHFDRQCPVCNLQVDSRDELIAHIDTQHHVPGSFCCPYCGIRFPTPTERDSHVNDQHYDEEVGCDDCGERFCCKCKDSNGHANMENSGVDNSYQNDSMADVDPLEASPPPGQLFVQCLYNVKREDLSHMTQCAIVTKMHKGKSVTEICKLYSITPEIVNEIWEERDSFVVPKKMSMKSSRYMNSILDGKILEWFFRQKELGVQVTGKMLINVAEEYAKEAGFVVFNGNIKWLDRFKTRHNISLRSTPIKRENVRAPNDAKWKEQFLTEIWPEVSKGYDFEDIYTGDEVGLFYNSSKGRIKKHTGRKFIHGFERDRFSIFMITNMNGDDRKKLLVSGSEDPLPYSHRHPSTLPVTYIRHNKSHFTTDMFEEYVKGWNRELQLEDKRAMLILDRASIHTKMSLSNLKLVFVPWKASTGLMPIKHGIYNRFRDEFRKLVLQEKAMNALKGIDRSFTCLEGLELINKAWFRVPRETIINSFEVTGYKVPERPMEDVKIPRVSENDDQTICKMLEDYDVPTYYMDVTLLDMYLTVDEELLSAQGTNGSVFGGNHKVIDPIQRELEQGEILPIAVNKTDVAEKQKLILKARALEDLEIVRKYLESNKTSFATFKAFMDVEKFLLRNPPK